MRGDWINMDEGQFRSRNVEPNEEREEYWKGSPSRECTMLHPSPGGNEEIITPSIFYCSDIFARFTDGDCDCGCANDDDDV